MYSRQWSASSERASDFLHAKAISFQIGERTSPTKRNVTFSKWITVVQSFNNKMRSLYFSAAISKIREWKVINYARRFKVKTHMFWQIIASTSFSNFRFRSFRITVAFKMLSRAKHLKVRWKTKKDFFPILFYLYKKKFFDLLTDLYVIFESRLISERCV